LDLVSCSPINGKIVMLIPNKVILFEEPDDDAVSAAGADDFIDINGQRFFSSAFYADLLAHLGAALVVCFDDALPASVADSRRAAFSAAGIGYCTLEDLCSGGANRFSLQSLDRFITLAASCSGLVAVQCRGALAGDAACTHLAALMLRQRSFSTTAHAVAWMQMTHPGRLTEAIDLALLEQQLAQRAGRRLRDRSFSISGCAGGPACAGPLASLSRIEEDTSAGPASPQDGRLPSPDAPPALALAAKTAAAAGPPGKWHWPTAGGGFSASSPSLPVHLRAGPDADG
jgi:hypothetical protein